MELPIELQNLIMIAAGMAVTFFLTQLAKIGFDLSGFKAQWTAALFSFLLVLVNAVLGKVPLEWQSILTAILQLVVVLLGSFGVYKLYKQSK
jgi:hypothetical protein